MDDMKELFDEITAILEKGKFDDLVVEPNKNPARTVKEEADEDPAKPARTVYHEEGRNPKQLPGRNPNKPYWTKRVSSSRLRDHFLARMKADGRRVQKPKRGGMYLILDGQPVTHYRNENQITIMGEGVDDYAKGYLKLYQFFPMYKKVLRGMAMEVFADHNGNSLAIGPHKVIFR